MKCTTSNKDLRSHAKVHLPKDYPWIVLGLLADDLRDCFQESEYLRVKAVVRSRDFGQYLQLSKEWGPQSNFPAGMRQTTMFARYQIASLLKKFQFPGDRKSRQEAALEKFAAAELACREFNRSGWRTLANPEEETDLLVLTYARKYLEDLLGFVLPDRGKLTEWSRHGPGSNLDTKKRQTSSYHKYGNWPYSCTRHALGLARLAIQDDERWLGALEDDYRNRYSIPKHVILDQEVFWASVLNVVPGNRITFVPKNALTERSIAIEPCMNLYLQLGVDGYIRRRLKRWGVDLDSQEKNQRLSCEGSGGWSGTDPYVTLDLSAASDSISLEVCRVLLPPPWYNYLIKLRSPYGDLGGRELEYEKISSMGNGFTFALESAIFSAFVFAAQRVIHGTVSPSECAIFGDDLVIRKSISALVIRSLERAGFAINEDKSFIDGPFRESCGADWFAGTPVRPVFFTEQPTTVMGLWCDINRIRRILSLRLVGFEFHSTRAMEKWIPDSLRDCTGPPSDEEFDSYLHVLKPPKRDRHSRYPFTRLAVTRDRVRGDNFLFRKLMHQLREAPVSPFHRDRWGGGSITGSGSRFTVYGLSVTVGRKRSLAWYWPEEYVDTMLSD